MRDGEPRNDRAARRGFHWRHLRRARILLRNRNPCAKDRSTLKPTPRNNDCDGAARDRDHVFRPQPSGGCANRR
jgi:hypothetical protein